MLHNEKKRQAQPWRMAGYVELVGLSYEIRFGCSLKKSDWAEKNYSEIIHINGGETIGICDNVYASLKKKKRNLYISTLFGHRTNVFINFGRNNKHKDMVKLYLQSAMKCWPFHSYRV